MILTVARDRSALAIHVPRAYPIRHRVIGAVFVASLRHHIEKAINPQKGLAAAAKARPGMEDFSRVILVENEMPGVCVPFRRKTPIDVPAEISNYLWFPAAFFLRGVEPVGCPARYSVAALVNA